MKTIISQIFLSDHSEKLPIFLEKSTASLLKYFPGCVHKVYNNEELRDFIKSHYSHEVLWAYDSLRPYAYRSDLGRFCLLYQLGGWYFDISIECLSSFSVPEGTDLVCFRDEQKHSGTTWATANGLIWSKPGNDIFSAAIDDVVLNCKEKWYGHTPLCPTGPSLYGAAIAKKHRGKKLIIGELIVPKNPFTSKNLNTFKRIFRAKFVLPNGHVFALLKPAGGGDLKSLGVKGSNNYNDLWHSRTVYNHIELGEK